MESFTPVSALVGGALIGAAASWLLLMNGRIAGVSGIAGGLIRATAGDRAWRLAFLVGLAVGVLVYRAGVGWRAGIGLDASLPALLVGGVLVGLGTRIGGGCTSGHGVCGISRLSARSMVATVTFMVTAGVTVFVTRHLLGGG